MMVTLSFEFKSLHVGGSINFWRGGTASPLNVTTIRHENLQP